MLSQGTVAFVAQQAWIQNATVRENILFGKEYNEDKYETIVDAVALRPDFEILDNGDLTFIGEKVCLGITSSMIHKTVNGYQTEQCSIIFMKALNLY